MIVPSFRRITAGCATKTQKLTTTSLSYASSPDHADDFRITIRRRARKPQGPTRGRAQWHQARRRASQRCAPENLSDLFPSRVGWNYDGQHCSLGFALLGTQPFEENCCAAPAKQQVRNKEICESQDNGDFDKAWIHRCRPGIFNFYIWRININFGAFTSGGSPADTPHAVGILTPVENSTPIDHTKLPHPNSHLTTGLRTLQC